jgi:hypothetical protein
MLILAMAPVIVVVMGVPAQTVIVVHLPTQAFHVHQDLYKAHQQMMYNIA